MARAPGLLPPTQTLTMRLPAPLLALAVLALAAVPAPAAGQQSPEAGAMEAVTLPPELDRVLRDYETAWRARDAAGLAALFTDDGFILRPNRPAVRGRARIEEAYGGAGGPLVLRAWDYATSGDVGWILGGYGAAEDGPEFGKYTLTLRLGDDGRWLIASDMDNGNG